MFRRILIGLIVLAALAYGASQIFKAQIGMWIFDRVTDVALGRDALADLPDGLHAVMCGTGSPMGDVSRNGPCTAILAGDRLFIVDIGGGAARALGPMGISAGRIEALFLTHFHSDHIDGIGELALQRWATVGNDQPMPIYGAQGVERIVNGFNEAYRLDQGYRVEHHTPEIMPPSGFGSVARPFDIYVSSVVLIEEGDLKVTAFPVSHSPVEPAVGYRFDYKGRSIVISGDTAYSERLVSEAQGADVLFHDVLNNEWVKMMGAKFEERGNTHAATIFADILDYHASPKQAAQAAENAGVDMLVMHHIVPVLPLTYLEAAYLRNVGDVYSGTIVMGRDGMTISLPANSDEIIRK